MLIFNELVLKNNPIEKNTILSLYRRGCSVLPPSPSTKRQNLSPQNSQLNFIVKANLIYRHHKNYKLSLS